MKISAAASVCRGDQLAVLPPLTRMICPVTKEVFSEARRPTLVLGSRRTGRAPAVQSFWRSCGAHQTLYDLCDEDDEALPVIIDH
jgi:hypothetical protein